MTTAQETRLDWTDGQNDLIVADYFDMFGRLTAGEKINRLERNRELQILTGRTKGSIERKRMNISGVLEGLDMEWMEGFAPNDHFQIPLADAVQRYLDRHPEWLEDTTVAKRIDLDAPLSEESPPPLGPPPAPPKAAMERIAVSTITLSETIRIAALAIWARSSSITAKKGSSRRPAPSSRKRSSGPHRKRAMA